MRGTTLRCRLRRGIRGAVRAVIRTLFRWGTIRRVASLALGLAVVRSGLAALGWFFDVTEEAMPGFEVAVGVEPGTAALVAACLFTALAITQQGGRGRRR